MRSLRPLLGLVAFGFTLSTTACLREPFQDVQAAQAPEPDPSAQRRASLEQDVMQLRRELEARDAGLASAALVHADMTKKVDELTVQNAELTERLRGAGASVEMLASERQRLLQELGEARTRLETLTNVPGATDPPGPQARSGD